MLSKWAEVKGVGDFSWTARGGSSCGLFVAVGGVDFSWRLAVCSFRSGSGCGLLSWRCGLFAAAGGVGFCWRLCVWTFRSGWGCGHFVAGEGVNFSWRLAV